jgi:hypothetical protein
MAGYSTVLLSANSMLVYIYITSDSMDDFLSGSNNSNHKGGNVLRMIGVTARKILRAY